MTLIDRFGLGSAMLANRRTRQFQVTRDRADALLADQMTAPNFGNHIHKQHPQTLQRNRRMIARIRVETIGRCYLRNLETFARCFAGMSHTAIAKVLLVDDNTIRTWYALY
jgi:hypothetical protein